MEALAKQACKPCRGDSPAVPRDQWAKLLETLPGWQVAEQGGVPMLTKRFKRADFVAALELANAVGALAEAEDHHPRLVVEYGSLEVSWWTHTIRGLHMNDFILAARTEHAA